MYTIIACSEIMKYAETRLVEVDQDISKVKPIKWNIKIIIFQVHVFVSVPRWLPR